MAPGPDRRTVERRDGDITRAEVWRLVDDSNQQWRDAQARQTDAIDRLSAALGDQFKALNDRISKNEDRLAKHEDNGREVALIVHDIAEREKNRMRQVTAASGLVAMIVGPGAAVLFKKWFGY